MYLKGVSTGDMDAALEVLVGPDSRRVVGKCGIAAQAQLGEDYRAWRTARLRLDKDHWVYAWADGTLCALVVIGGGARRAA